MRVGRAENRVSEAEAGLTDLVDELLKKPETSVEGELRQQPVTRLGAPQEETSVRRIFVADRQHPELRTAAHVIRTLRSLGLCGGGRRFRDRRTHTLAFSRAL